MIQTFARRQQGTPTPTRQHGSRFTTPKRLKNCYLDATKTTSDKPTTPHGPPHPCTNYSSTTAKLKPHKTYSTGRSTSTPSKTNIDAATRRVLRELSLPVPGIKEIDDHISTDDFEQDFKHWNEATSTSPSGRHLGHYKAILALRHLEPDKDEDGNPIETTSQLILEAITTVARLAIRKGLILDRWLNVTNVMIELIPGKPFLNKLRVIHLFEADFNLCLRILWGQRLMRQAESRKKRLATNSSDRGKGKAPKKWFFTRY
jgi:hypothetical protein